MSGLQSCAVVFRTARRKLLIDSIYSTPLCLRKMFAGQCGASFFMDEFVVYYYIITGSKKVDNFHLRANAGFLYNKKGNIAVIAL